MGWIKDRGRRIDAGHWRDVRGLLDPIEQPLDYIRIHEGELFGWLHLTSHRLVWTSMWAGKHQREGSIGLVELEVFATTAGAPKSMIAKLRDGRAVRFDVPRDVPKAFIRLFVSEVRQAARLET